MVKYAEPGSLYLNVDHPTHIYTYWSV